jgi:hypothetical protein
LLTLGAAVGIAFGGCHPSSVRPQSPPFGPQSMSLTTPTLGEERVVTFDALPSAEKKRELDFIWGTKGCNPDAVEVVGAHQHMFGLMRESMDSPRETQKDRLWAEAYEYGRKTCYHPPPWLFEMLRKHYPRAFYLYYVYYFPGDAIGFMEEDPIAFHAFQIGLKLATNGQYQTAERALINSVKHSSDFVEAWDVLGSVDAADGRQRDSMETWRKTLDHYGFPIPEEENFGPRPAWISALVLYERTRNQWSANGLNISN